MCAHDHGMMIDRLRRCVRIAAEIAAVNDRALPIFERLDAELQEAEAMADPVYMARALLAKKRMSPSKGISTEILR